MNLKNDSIINDIKEILKNNLSNNDFSSTNILISGPWGSGKTTLKNNIFKDLVSIKNYIVIDINIWLESENNLSEIIFLKLLDYGLVTTNLTTQRKRTLESIIKKFINRTNVLNFINDCINEEKNYGFDEIKKYIQEKNKVTYAIKELIDFIFVNSKIEKIIFLYDELDRCNEIFIKNFFSELKNLFNYEKLVHIIFANEQYINEMFINLDKRERFIDKYFNHQIRIEPDVVKALDDLWQKITKSDDYFSFYYKNEKKQQHKIFNLIRNTVSYRDLANSQNSLKIFFNNYFFYQKKVIRLRNWDFYWDDVVIYVCLLLVLKKIYKINNLSEFENIIHEFSIKEYFCFEKYKNSINDWIESLNQFIIDNHYTFEDFEIKEIKNIKEDFLYSLAIQTNKTIMYYFENNIYNRDLKYFFENSKIQLVSNINKILKLFKNDFTKEITND